MNKKIYQNKLKTIIVLILMVLIILGLTLYTFVFNNYNITDIFSLIVIAFLIYAIYSSVNLFIKAFKTSPVIIFSDYAIEISRNFKDESFSWAEITDWRILHHADSEEIGLTIGGTQHFIEISDLKTTASEIRSILELMLPGKEFVE